ncbi:hypothetical protein AMR41_27085 [Hapalosiphon sp. MRB220]|nr:hypothetical protein AMR41_27085 [Hapalosiphon sp. MRB220]
MRLLFINNSFETFGIVRKTKTSLNSLELPSNRVLDFEFAPQHHQSGGWYHQGIIGNQLRKADFWLLVMIEKINLSNCIKRNAQINRTFSFCVDVINRVSTFGYLIKEDA